MTRAYNVDGLAGCVQRRPARQNGALVAVYNARQARLDEEAGPWATSCEDHGTVVNHRSLALARSHAADPEGWCELCRYGDGT